MIFINMLSAGLIPNIPLQQWNDKKVPNRIHPPALKNSRNILE